MRVSRPNVQVHCFRYLRPRLDRSIFTRNDGIRREEIRTSDGPYKLQALLRKEIPGWDFPGFQAGPKVVT